MLILLGTILSLTAIYLIQDNGVLTSNKLKQLASISVIVIAAFILCNEYGTLRGIFIGIGVVSLLGTVFTLLRYKWHKTSQ